MKALSILTPLIALSALAGAQAPVYIQLPAGYTPTDCARTPTGTIVVGRHGGQAFRWTPASGPVDIGTASGNIRVSRDGNVMAGDVGSTVGIWTTSNPTWTTVPNLGGNCSGTVMTTSGLSGDGNVIVGLAYMGSCIAVGFKYDHALGTTTDIGPALAGFSYRAMGVDFDGDTIVGWNQTPAASRNGAIWTGATPPMTGLLINIGGNARAEAYSSNDAGTIVVGQGGFASPNAWRWDFGVGPTALAHPSWNANNASAQDLTDDGSVIIGTVGTQLSGGVTPAVWDNGTPVQLMDYLVSLGTSGLPGTIPGNATAISHDGKTLVGSGGWIVDYPVPGNAFCTNSTLGSDHTSACPCGNVGLPERGCAHSFSNDGAQLSAEGDIPSDAVALRAIGLPATSFTLFMQHDAIGDTVFHDGVLCAGGTLVRLRGRNAGGAGQPGPGMALYPNTNFANDTQTLSQRGGVTIGSGAVRYYAAWYRNASTTFCPPATANVSNGWTLTW